MTAYNVNIAMPGYVGPVDLVGGAVDTCKAIFNQAIELAQQQQYSAAVELLEKSVEQNPRWIPLRQLLIQLYLDTNRPVQARQEILRLHELGHKDPQFVVLLGAVWLRKRRFAEAILSFREAKVLGAPAGEWLIAMAEALLRTGRLGEAEAILQDQKESAEKERSRLFAHLSAIRLQQKRYQEAVNFALEALREKPARARAYHLLGQALMGLGENEGATRAFEEYIRWQPNRASPYRFLERIARESGDDDQADAYNLKARGILEDRRSLRVEKQRLAAEGKS